MKTAEDLERIRKAIVVLIGKNERGVALCKDGNRFRFSALSNAVSSDEKENENDALESLKQVIRKRVEDEFDAALKKRDEVLRLLLSD